MKRVLFASMVAATLAACGSDAVPGGAPPDAGGDGSNTSPQITDVTASVTADATWSGTIRIHNAISIAANVTVTVMPGSTIQVALGANLTVDGTLTISGTKASPVIVQGLSTDDWATMSVPSGGTFSMTYGTWTGGNINVAAGGTFTVRDSQLSQVFGDLLTAEGGDIDVQYSWIGLAAGGHDTTHCDMHFEGNGGPTISVTHSNISTSAYGVMFYTGVGADFTYNNWFSNTIQVDKTTGVTGDFSNGYFDKNPPSGTGITANNLATAMITDAGPR